MLKTDGPSYPTWRLPNEIVIRSRSTAREIAYKYIIQTENVSLEVMANWFHRSREPSGKTEPTASSISPDTSVKTKTPTSLSKTSSLITRPCTRISLTKLSENQLLNQPQICGKWLTSQSPTKQHHPVKICLTTSWTQVALRTRDPR